MGQNTQSRKWSLVINNPSDCGLTHQIISEIIMRFSPEYYCMSDEIASTGTYHTHVFFYSHSPVRFGTLKGRFPTAHIEKAYGSAKENRDYVVKSGKWADSEKAETIVEGTFQEYGDLPAEKEEKHPKMFKLIRSVQNGKSTAEIIGDLPDMAFRVRDIDTLRQMLLSEQYTNENRNLEVTYIYGASGTGKTRGIYQRHHPKDICRITNYRTGKGISFDNYFGQNILVFEEFHSQIPIEDMLNYLDVYPLFLPARYNDRVACYTVVYITSNQPLGDQYKDVQWNRYETWKAFLRRIYKVIEYRHDGSIQETICNKKELFLDKPK